MGALKILAQVGATAMALAAILNLVQCDAPQYSVEWLYAACSADFWLGVTAVCWSLPARGEEPAP